MLVMRAGIRINENPQLRNARNTSKPKWQGAASITITMRFFVAMSESLARSVLRIFAKTLAQTHIHKGRCPAKTPTRNRQLFQALFCLARACAKQGCSLGHHTTEAKAFSGRWLFAKQACAFSEMLHGCRSLFAAIAFAQNHRCIERQRE